MPYDALLPLGTSVVALQ